MPGSGQSTMLRTQLRPTRLAFLLPSGSFEVLQQAILTAGALWGGMRSVLLPLDGELLATPEWTAVLTAARPDHIVALGTPSSRTWEHLRSLGMKWTVQMPRIAIPPQPQLSSPLIFVPP